MSRHKPEDRFADVPSHWQLRKQPKQERSRQAYDKILDAAIDIAAEQGIISVNTNAIAERAGMDVASVYRTFPNKESIFYWAADRWLVRVRKACETMEGEEFEQLAWREFFTQLGKLMVSVPEFNKAYLPLQSLWIAFPEYQVLADKHYDYMVLFFVRHFKRFGATLPKPQLESLAYYLIVTSDRVRELGPSLPPKREQAIYQWEYETWMMHLARIFPD